MSDYLSIPKRDRSKYEFVWCGKCSRRVSQNCGLTKKKIYTCKYGKHHKFKASVYIPGTGNQRATKNFDTRDYKQFQREAKAFAESVEGSSIEVEKIETTAQPSTILPTPPTIPQESEAPSVTFKSAVQMFLDWLQDIDVEPQFAQNLSDNYIKSNARYLSHFAKALVLKGFDSEILYIKDLGDKHVGAFYLYMTEIMEDGEPRFAPKTYNDALGVMKRFYQFINKKLKTNLPNPFEDVKRQTVVTIIATIELDEFNSVIKLVTKKNGEYLKKDRGKLYKNNHYKPWLRDAFKLGLETGERRDGVVLMRWQDVKDGHVEIPNYKEERRNKKQLPRRKAPMTRSLIKLLVELGWKEKKGSTDFIIAPDYKNRNALKERISKAFTHYWKLTGIDKDISFRHLRKTYVTLMWAYFGKDTPEITGQAEDTILYHYLNTQVIIEKAQKVGLGEVDKATKSIQKEVHDQIYQDE